MKRNRLKLVFLALVATVSTNTGAYALENEFHGSLRVRGIIDNFSDGSPGELVPTKNPRTRNFIEQRARLMYIAKANDDLKMVSIFEIDSRWGDNSYNSNGTTRNNGGAIGADQTSIETKNIYLDFNIPSTPLNVKLGMQAFSDGYKGVVFSNDAAGMVVKAKMGFGSLGGAYFRFDDAIGVASGTGNNTYLGSYVGTGGTPPKGYTATQYAGVNNLTPGTLTRDLVNLNGKFNVAKDVMVGADWYLLYSDIMRNVQARTALNMFGVNAEAKLGPATVDGFFLYQMGKLGTNEVPGVSAQNINAFAANVGSRAKVGPGTLRGNVLYLSGDKSPSANGERNDFQTLMERGATSSGTTFYASEMMIMLRNKLNGNADRDLIFSLNNQAQGIIGGFIGYDLGIDKFFVNSNIGLSAVAKNRGPALASAVTYNNANGKNDYIGTEINTEIGYRMFENLTVSTQIAYLFLGGYYTNAAGAHPENPYSTKIQFNYTY